MQLTVSIVITNYNYGRFLAHAIESALDQVAANVEVIVVDDGSTDDSTDVIERYADRVTAVLTANGGQGAACNAGWRKATGQIVIFLDADDVLHPRTASRVVQAFVDNDRLSRVQYPLNVVDITGKPTGKTIPASAGKLFSGDAVPLLLRCPDDIAWQPTSGNAFARRALEAIMPMPEKPYRICADYYLSNLTPLHGPVAVLAAAGGDYRVHADNGHFSPVQTLDRLRQDVQRTNVTHSMLIEHCRLLGLTGLGTDPGSVRSVSAAANRIISYRFDSTLHPLCGDTRARLVVLGVRSAVARRDVGAVRRMTFALWFVAAAIAPRACLRMVVRPYVCLSTS